MMVVIHAPTNNRARDQHHAQRHRLRMKSKQPLEAGTQRIRARHAVCGEPVFIEPYVEQQYRRESREVKEILLDRHTSDDDVRWRADEDMTLRAGTKCRRRNTQRCLRIRKRQEQMCEEE